MHRGDLSEQGRHQTNYPKMEVYLKDVLTRTTGVSGCSLRMQPFAALLIINGLKSDAAFCSLPENENAAFCNLSFSTKKLEWQKPSR